jgi:hypothetical protein
MQVSDLSSMKQAIDQKDIYIQQLEEQVKGLFFQN